MQPLSLAHPRTLGGLVRLVPGVEEKGRRRILASIWLCRPISTQLDWAGTHKAKVPRRRISWNPPSLFHATTYTVPHPSRRVTVRLCVPVASDQTHRHQLPTATTTTLVGCLSYSGTVDAVDLRHSFNGWYIQVGLQCRFQPQKKHQSRADTTVLRRASPVRSPLWGIGRRA
jgi:hypothetical protein